MTIILNQEEYKVNLSRFYFTESYIVKFEIDDIASNPFYTTYYSNKKIQPSLIKKKWLKDFKHIQNKSVISIVSNSDEHNIS